MKKSITALALATILFLSWSPVFAEEKELTVAEATDELTETIEDRPVSLLDYADTGASLLLRITEKLWKTGKPMAAFKKGRERLGLEFSAFEEERFDLTVGKFFVQNEDEGEENGIPSLEKDWFIGIELKGIPFASDINEVFEKLRPQILLYQHKVWLGLSYKFRESSTNS